MPKPEEQVPPEMYGPVQPIGRDAHGRYLYLRSQVQAVDPALVLELLRSGALRPGNMRG